MSALVTYMTQMLTSLMTLIDVFKLLIRARTSVRRVEEVLALPEEGTLEGPEEAGVEEPVLELRHVTFAYPGGGGVPAVQDISFTLRRGERLAVVGPTGAGKTTLAWLCARLYEPQKGELYLGGRPMSRLPLGQVRRQVVVAAQRSAIFPAPSGKICPWVTGARGRHSSVPPWRLLRPPTSWRRPAAWRPC